MKQSLDTSTRYIVEYQSLEEEKPKFYWTTNLKQAKKQAESYTLDKKFRNIKLHEAKILKSLECTPSVQFEEKKDNA